VTNPQVDGNRTVGENMCDNGGLSHAWHAYKSSKTVEPDEPGLPGVNYSRDQIFFITYGQVSIRFASGGHKSRIFQCTTRRLSPVDSSSSEL
jgi:predicted metalloendopeptidase